MVSTADKRRANPDRFARKDARTKIYRALFGPQDSKSKSRANSPWLDKSRDLPFDWTWQNAASVFEHNIDAAQFTKAERFLLEERLADLKKVRMS